MTREEAIKTLDAMWKMLTSAYDEIADSFVLAYSMAIDALKAQMDGDVVIRNAIIKKLNAMDRYKVNELVLCDTDEKFPKNEVFIVDDVYEGIVEQLPSAQPEPCEDAVSRADAFNAINDYVNTVGVLDGYTDTQEVLRIVKRLPSTQPVLDRTKISDLLEKIYSIQSPHLSTEGVIAKKYYCKQLWVGLFGSEDVPKWID